MRQWLYSEMVASRSSDRTKGIFLSIESTAVTARGNERKRVKTAEDPPHKN